MEIAQRSKQCHSVGHKLVLKCSDQWAWYAGTLAQPHIIELGCLYITRYNRINSKYCTAVFNSIFRVLCTVPRLGTSHVYLVYVCMHAQSADLRFTCTCVESEIARLPLVSGKSSGKLKKKKKKRKKKRPISDFSYSRATETSTGVSTAFLSFHLEWLSHLAFLAFGLHNNA